MKKSVFLASLLVGMISLVGCGSSSDSNKNGTTGATESTADQDSDSGSSSAENSVPANAGAIEISSGTPVTLNVACDPEAYSAMGVMADIKVYADGDITAECQTVQDFTFVTYGLKSTVSSLAVTQVMKEEYIDTVDNNNAAIKVKASYDYQAGTVRYEGSRAAETVDCVETYPSILPLTVTNSEEVGELLEWFGDEADRISTTCLDNYYDERDEVEGMMDTLSGTMLSNYTIIDSDNKQHLLAREIAFSY